MTRRLRLSYHNLHTLKDAHPKLRKAIISNCNRNLVNNISECALNILRGNVRLTDCQKRKLGKFKRQLRTVVDKRVHLARKESLIIQRGGFIVPLLSAVLSTLASLIYNSVSGS